MRYHSIMGNCPPYYISKTNRQMLEKTLRNDFYLKNIVYEIEKVIKLVWDSEKG